VCRSDSVTPRWALELLIGPSPELEATIAALDAANRRWLCKLGDLALSLSGRS